MITGRSNTAPAVFSIHSSLSKAGIRSRLILLNAWSVITLTFDWFAIYGQRFRQSLISTADESYHAVRKRRISTFHDHYKICFDSFCCIFKGTSPSWYGRHGEKQWTLFPYLPLQRLSWRYPWARRQLSKMCPFIWASLDFFCNLIV